MTWIANIGPMRMKNGQLHVCIDFRDLKNACPKDYFFLSINDITVYSTNDYEAFNFMDRSFTYNQILMDQKDEEMIAFLTTKGIYCYKTIPF